MKESFLHVACFNLLLALDLENMVCVLRKKYSTQEKHHLKLIVEIL